MSCEKPEHNVDPVLRGYGLVRESEGAKLTGAKLNAAYLSSCNSTCFEKRGINDRNLCPAESPLTKACDCPEQSSRDTGLPVHLIRSAHRAGVDARQWVESVQICDCQQHTNPG